MRFWFVLIVLFILVLLPFLIWGDWFSNLFSESGTIDQLQTYGSWAWAAGILLLIGDLFLPLPGTIIMSGLGYLYGPILGGIFATLGSFLSGLLAYGLCRSMGASGALFLLGEKDFQKGQLLFAKNGGWIVAISRWLPIFPEIVACMAGLNQMPFYKYVLALLCGALPLGFVFAYIGYTGESNPYLAVSISAILPAILWAISGRLMAKMVKNS